MSKDGNDEKEFVHDMKFIFTFDLQTGELLKCLRLWDDTDIDNPNDYGRGFYIRNNFLTDWYKVPYMRYLHNASYDGIVTKDCNYKDVLFKKGDKLKAIGLFYRVDITDSSSTISGDYSFVVNGINGKSLNKTALIKEDCCEFNGFSTIQSTRYKEDGPKPAYLHEGTYNFSKELAAAKLYNKMVKDQENNPNEERVLRWVYIGKLL